MRRATSTASDAFLARCRPLARKVLPADGERTLVYCTRDFQQIVYATLCTLCLQRNERRIYTLDRI